MRKKTLFQIVIVLLFVNIAILYVWQQDDGDGGTSSVGLVEQEGVEAEDDVATVGGQSITYSDLSNQLYRSHGTNELTDMINKEIVRQAGKDKGISIDEKVISRDIALLASMQHGLQKEEVDREKERWYNQIVYRYTLEALLTEDMSMSEEEVRVYYDTYKNQYNFAESMQLSHIIVPTMDEAEQVKNELDEGAPFGLLAQEYSIDEETKNKGGYFGHISISSQFMPAGYYEQALELDPFSYSEPFQTDQGAVILFLHEHYPSYEFTYDELRPYIERELLLKNMDEHIDATDLWDAYDVEWLYELE